jgi:beta-fructofuranosidase
VTASDRAGRRPALHFTPAAGWINDPHGIVHADGVYHLFFQYNPAGAAWAAAVSWGHATSADLLTWQEQPVALAPGPGEVGCWSGSVVLSDHGVPTMFYTRVDAADLDLGRIGRAVGDPSLLRWRRDPPGPVIAGGPPGVRMFRDPFVWREPDGWRMLVGAGLADGSGAVVQYRSADLLAWAYDGIPLSGAAAGSMWECPQLFALDGVWVLLFSALHDDGPGSVVYALGDYDGATFTPATWGTFGYGPAIYATTTFRDADGRRCAMSWLRERDPVTGWAGALSVPWVLRVAGDRLRAEPHPRLGGAARTAGPGVTDLGGGAAVTVDAGAVVVTAGGAELLRMPGGPSARIVVDADIIEIAVAGTSGVGATRWGTGRDDE